MSTDRTALARPAAGENRAARFDWVRRASVAVGALPFLLVRLTTLGEHIAGGD